MQTHLVVAGYLFHKDKVLLIHHRKLDIWLPPGGHIDKDEVPDEALIREFKEEVNLDIEIPIKSIGQGNVTKELALPFHVNLHSVGDHNHCCFYYLCKTKNPDKLRINNELKNFAWLTKDELFQPHIPAGVRTIALRGFEILDEENFDEWK